MSENRKPAEVFRPGVFIAEEIEARGWTVADLARKMRQPIGVIRRIVEGTGSITPDVAVALGRVLGTGVDVWLNLERSYVEPSPPGEGE